MIRKARMSLRFAQAMRLPAPLPHVSQVAARMLPRHLDGVLLGAAVTLSMVGALLVWSATLPPTGHAGPTVYAWRHLGHLLLAATCASSPRRPPRSRSSWPSPRCWAGPGRGPHGPLPQTC